MLESSGFFVVLFILYCFGEQPILFLKILLKWYWSLNPTIVAISDIGRVVELKNAVAEFNRKDNLKL